MNNMKKLTAIFLEIIGVGYRATSTNNGTSLHLKFGKITQSIQADPGVRTFTFPPTGGQTSGTGISGIILCIGIEPEKVSKFAAKIKAIHPPENYKGKGIRYRNEKIFRKKP